MVDRKDPHEPPRPPRRHHPHLPEVRPRRFPQPDGAAARPGLAGVRAPAHLRQHAPADRGGAGPRRPHRPEPDRAASGRASKRSWRCCASASARSSKPTRPARVETEARQQFHDQAGAGSTAGQAREALSGGRARGAAPRPRTALVSRRRRARPVRPAAAAAHRTARREVPGRRAGRQVRVHRPHADDRAGGAGDQGGAGDDRQAARSSSKRR